ncbi:hypothetical protein G9A89_013317 [Geosiphon pyriformis]|nr:hypothetical protein G9A89_013317 [Geosiphon pyriformis]
MLRKKLGKPLEDTTIINLIKSLFIIQRTPQQNLQINQNLQIPYFLHIIHESIILQKISTDNTKPKISSLLGTPMNIESARETFYKELIQNTNLPTNHNFGKLQTPAITPRKIQPLAWKKNRVESPSNSSYHYTSESIINISSTDAFPSIATSAFGRFSFQRLRSSLSPPDFGISDLWEAAESEKEEEESEDQEFTYQHPITENPELPPQQPRQQQLLQQPPQPPNLNPMAYAPIAKLDNFTGKEDDTQIWLNDVEKAIAANGWNNTQAMQAIPYFLKDTANSWYQSLINKPQDFNAFKAEFLKYFSNNNSINRLVNVFTTMKQGETEAVTTYLGRFHRNLCQIQAINANYFTALQIFNQFIHGLCSSILQHVHLLHLGTLQDTVTYTRNFESAESEANHAQAVNLVINGSSELDSKLEKFSELINKRLEGYLADNHAIYQPPQRHNNQGNSNLLKSKSTRLPTSDTVISLSVSSISTSDLSATATSNISTTATNNLSIPTDPNTVPKLTTQQNSKTKNDSTELEISDSSLSTDPQFFTNYLSLLVTPEDASTNSPAFTQKQPLTSNIPPATITKNESLAAIFPFKFEETAAIPLFSGAALEAKPITVMYIDTKVEKQSIKLILDSGSASSIITRQLMNQLVNDIVTPIKVLVMEATQYQALVSNDWLFKVNATLNWNTQELQLMYQGQHICVLAMYGHFKTPPREKLLIELEEKKGKPTWEAYQVLWVDKEHNKLPPILFWDDSNKGKGKQKEELTWKTDDLTWTNNNKNKSTSSWEWEEDKENKEKGKEKETTQIITTYNNTYTILQ